MRERAARYAYDRRHVDPPARGRSVHGERADRTSTTLVSSIGLPRYPFLERFQISPCDFVLPY